jgi:hypothetical protein
VIGGQVRDVKFSMDAADRVAGRKCTSTFSFVSSSPVPVGGSISLVYPSGFFSFSYALEASRSGSRVAIVDTLRWVQVNLYDSAAGASTNALISFTPTAAGIINRFVITLSGFSMAPGQIMSVSDGRYGGNVIGIAAILDGVLTVTFTSGLQTFNQFIVSNIRNPTQVAPLSSLFIGQSRITTGAATFAGSALLDSSTSAYVTQITDSLSPFGFDLDNPYCGSSTNVRIYFKPTNVNNLNRFVVMLNNFTSVPGQSMVVSSFSGIGGSPAATATLVSGVLTVTFTSGSFTTRTAVWFAVSNIQTPPVAGLYRVTGATTYAGSNLLDSVLITDASWGYGGTAAFIYDSLRSISISLENSAAGSSTNAWISFTPTNVNNLNRFVVTLSNFTRVPSQSMMVSSFSGINSGPAATATLVSGILTVTFTSGSFTTGTQVSFTVSNVLNPSFLPPYSCSEAATYAASGVLDSTTRCQITDSLRAVYMSLDNYAAGASTNARISFMPTNINNFNRFVITLNNFTSAPGQIMSVCCFSGMSGNPSATAAFGTFNRSTGLRARWYDIATNWLPSTSWYDTAQAKVQNAVPNLDFPRSATNDEMSLFSGGLRHYFAARFDGYSSCCSEHCVTCDMHLIDCV